MPSSSPVPPSGCSLLPRTRRCCSQSRTTVSESKKSFSKKSSNRSIRSKSPTRPGLGLSLSKSLAHKLRGDIRVQSTFGEGTLFTLELPILAEENLTQPAAEPEPAAADTQETDDTPENKTGNTAVLIVEDNEELRDFIHGCLAEYYTVYEAENGIKALEVIEANTIDIIVSDITASPSMAQTRKHSRPIVEPCCPRR